MSVTVRQRVISAVSEVVSTGSTTGGGAASSSFESNYHQVLEDNLGTVLAAYEPHGNPGGDYQSEAQLEAEFIKQLESQGYESVSVNNHEQLVTNLRRQLEKFNNIQFSDGEWGRLYTAFINTSDGIEGKTKRIQTDPRFTLTMDDGTQRNIALLDRHKPFRNYLQVTHQVVTGAPGVVVSTGSTTDSSQVVSSPDAYGIASTTDISQVVSTGSTTDVSQVFEAGAKRQGLETTGGRTTRFDVTILVNGLPLVQVELKRRGVPIREAFHQIERYQRDSFWAESGLFQYVQIFLISNGTHTRYYSNTTREGWLAKKSNSHKTSESYEFTMCWADARNHNIHDLTDFTRTFFAQRTLLNILCKYCVFDTGETLLVMRPYQIAAVEKILERIFTALNNRSRISTTDAGGYIWHTTGSGKTLTSFKTAQLATMWPEIDRVIFVVDRKDLDSQTVAEYKQFGAQELGQEVVDNFYTRSTKVLAQRLSTPKSRIVVTTIQKLSRFIAKNPHHPVRGENVVIIFDECHRSQFGKMHRDLTKYFKHYFIFGFTGTPIFADNAATVSALELARHAVKTGAGSTATQAVTTGQMFGEALHRYTIMDAISDKTVLGFKVDYVSTAKAKEGVTDKKITGIAKEQALLKPKRITKNVAYLLDHFDAKTYRERVYEYGRHDDGRVDRRRGFNSLLATASIKAAQRYYLELRKQIAERGDGLRVALIYSYSPNDEIQVVADEDMDTVAQLQKSDRDFLETAIRDYNADHGTNWNASADGFQLYYEDVSKRMKAGRIDILIVVNMFLTGFDAKTLNTLWVDKNLRYHGLIQAFSRTNRILNSVKHHGNIISFRDISANTDEALALFGSDRAAGLVLLRPFEEYYRLGYTDEKGRRCEPYIELVAELLERYPLDAEIRGPDAQKRFARLFGAILKLRNILNSFDEFHPSEVVSGPDACGIASTTGYGVVSSPSAVGESPTTEYASTTGGANMEILTAREWQDYQSRYLDIHDELSSERGAGGVDICDDVEWETELVKQVEVNLDYILMLITRYADEGKSLEVRTAIDKAVSASPTLRSKKKLIDAFIEQINTTPGLSWADFAREQFAGDVAALCAEQGLKVPEVTALLSEALRTGMLRTNAKAVMALFIKPPRMFDPDRAERRERAADALAELAGRYAGIAIPGGAAVVSSPDAYGIASTTVGEVVSSGVLRPGWNPGDSKYPDACGIASTTVGEVVSSPVAVGESSTTHIASTTDVLKVVEAGAKRQELETTGDAARFIIDYVWPAGFGSGVVVETWAHGGDIRAVLPPTWSDAEAEAFLAELSAKALAVA